MFLPFPVLIGYLWPRITVRGHNPHGYGPVLPHGNGRRPRPREGRREAGGLDSERGPGEPGSIVACVVAELVAVAAAGLQLPLCNPGTDPAAPLHDHGSERLLERLFIRRGLGWADAFRDRSRGILRIWSAGRCCRGDD